MFSHNQSSLFFSRAMLRRARGYATLTRPSVCPMSVGLFENLNISHDSVSLSCE